MSRILNRQRQLAEQGRLRLGYAVPAKTKDGRDTTRPVRSETWIVTSHSRELIERAADLWGGDVHEWEPMGNGAKQWRVITTSNAIPAILPPGDPLTQTYEMWSKGGCQRRCNGATEELSGSPCICLAQHGDQWYELSPRQVCSTKSRLKVLLPDMPGLGSWRMETGSYYATDEIAGMVDTLRGAVGDQVLIPVTLRIEPRARVAGGQTKQFVVPVLELRGVSAGALLSGQAIETRQLTTGNPESSVPLALQADPYAAYFEKVAAAGDVDELHAVWTEMVEQRLIGSAVTNTPRIVEFVEAYKARGTELTSQTTGGVGEGEGAARDAPSPDADGVVDAELVPDDQDADAVWQRILAVGGARGMTLGAILDDFPTQMGGLDQDQATAGELLAYLDKLNAREDVPA